MKHIWKLTGNEYHGVVFFSLKDVTDTIYSEMMDNPEDTDWLIEAGEMSEEEIANLHEADL